MDNVTKDNNLEIWAIDLVDNLWEGTKYEEYGWEKGIPHSGVALAIALKNAGYLDEIIIKLMSNLIMSLASEFLE